MRIPLFPPRRQTSRSQAFSLIELLSVMTLISVLAMATVPAMKGTLDGINISGAADIAKAEISLARQTAISRNLPVEVRIYKTDDAGGNGLAWRTIALVIPSSVSGRAEDEWVTGGKCLPGNVVIDDEQEYSTVVSKAAAPSGSPVAAPWTASETGTAPTLVKNKNYVGFYFNPDGSTNLPNNSPWCLTLRNPKSKPTGSGGPAANYVSIVVDSLTGRTFSYQP